MNTSNPISKALSNYEPYYERILRTGSRVICSPPPEDTDDDYLVLITPDNRQQFEDRLQLDGWALGGSLPNGPQLPMNPIPTVGGLIVQETGNLDWELNTTHEYKNGVIDQSRVFHSWKRWETPAVYGGPMHPGSILNSIVSISSGPEINLLVTCNEQYFDDFTRATFLCQGLNLLDKADRVIVFEALTRDVWPTGPKKKENNLLFKNGKGAILHEIFYGDDNPVIFNGLETLVNDHPIAVTQDGIDHIGQAIPVQADMNNTPAGWWNGVFAAVPA